MTELNEAPMKEKRHFKFLTFFSGLLTLILAIALFACVAYLSFVLFPQFFQGDGSDVDRLAAGIVGIILIPLMLGFCAIAVALAIMYLVLGIMLMTSSFKDDKVFSRRRGFVITTIVFDFIAVAILLLITFVVQPMPIIFLIVAIVMLFGTILKIVDLCLHKNRFKKSKLQNVSQTQTSVEVAPATNNNSETLNNENFSEKEERLKKLEEMKAAGLISDKEFEEMKKKTLEE